MARASVWPVFLPLPLCLALHFSTSSVQALLETRTIDDALGDSANPDAKQGPIGLHERDLNAPTQKAAAPSSPITLPRYSKEPGTKFYTVVTAQMPLMLNPTAFNYRSQDCVVCFLHPSGTYDQSVGPPFSRTPDQLTDSFQYNVTVFSNNLENKPHTFTMQINDPTHYSFVLFDYASYVYDDGVAEVKHDVPKPEAKQKSNLGLVIGAVVGGIIAIPLLIRVAYLLIVIIVRIVYPKDENVGRNLYQRLSG
ncbi:hypothetical protein L218DRAFT_1079533 [Marasmius fiardii PR-910]|nr:hypothetical protein L218DRAFT_1079533 [Marasmius fiardii PR-910]